MTITIKSSADGLSGVLQLNGADKLPFGSNTQEWTYLFSAGGTVNAMTGTIGVNLPAYRPGLRLSV